MKQVFEPEADYQPESFKFKSKKSVDEILSRYPKGTNSGVMPLLDLAQREMSDAGKKAKPVHGGWIPRAAMDEIAIILDMPKIKVYEVATFYSMYNTAPVGEYLVQVCTTTPCWLRGSDKIVKTCEKKLGVKMGGTTKDNKFTTMEVECLGACVNAPMVQVNDDYYEDLTPENTEQLLDDLEKGKKTDIGSQTNRKCSMSAAGPTTLEKIAEKAKVV